MVGNRVSVFTMGFFSALALVSDVGDRLVEGTASSTFVDVNPSLIGLDEGVEVFVIGLTVEDAEDVGVDVEGSPGRG